MLPADEVICLKRRDESGRPLYNFTAGRVPPTASPAAVTSDYGHVGAIGSQAILDTMIISTLNIGKTCCITILTALENSTTRINKPEDPSRYRVTAPLRTISF
jgi:hypothetical protein